MTTREWMFAVKMALLLAFLVIKIIELRSAQAPPKATDTTGTE